MNKRSEKRHRSAGLSNRSTYRPERMICIGSPTSTPWSTVKQHSAAARFASGSTSMLRLVMRCLGARTSVVETHAS